MKVEKLMVEEIPNLLELYRENIRCDNDEEIPQDIYKDMISDEKCAILVAKEDNKIIGSVLCVCCKSLDKDADSFLVIESPIIRKGKSKDDVGVNLIKASDEFARKKNCSYGIVVSYDLTKDACKLYEENGFVGDVRGLRKEYSFEN